MRRTHGSRQATASRHVQQPMHPLRRVRPRASMTTRGRAPAGGRASQSSHAAPTDEPRPPPAITARMNGEQLDPLRLARRRSSARCCRRRQCTRRAWPREGYARCGGETCQLHSARRLFSCPIPAARRIEVHARFRLSEPRPVYVSVMVSCSDLMMIRRRSYV